MKLFSRIRAFFQKPPLLDSSSLWPNAMVVYRDSPGDYIYDLDQDPEARALNYIQPLYNLTLVLPPQAEPCWLVYESYQDIKILDDEGLVVDVARSTIPVWPRQGKIKLPASDRQRTFRMQPWETSKKGDSG